MPKRQCRSAGAAWPKASKADVCREATPSSLVGANRSKLGDPPSVRHRVDRAMPHLRACRVCSKEFALFPLPRRSHGSRAKSSSAVRANVRKNRVHARRAERAFEAAYPRVACVRWEWLVAVFTRGSELEHEPTVASAQACPKDNNPTISDILPPRRGAIEVPSYLVSYPSPEASRFCFRNHRFLSS